MTEPVATLVVTVSVAVEACEPDGVTEVGLTLQVALVGAPVQVSEVCCVKPLAGVMEMVDVALGEDDDTVALVLLSEMLKSAAGGAALVMVMGSALDCEGALLASPP